MKKTVAIIGSGPAALMLAATLDEKLFDIVLYEKNFAPARKFLVAGEGGFNLTHSEDPANFITRYSPASFIEKSFHSFTNIDLRNWLKEAGIETYVGSSKRVFPIKGIKPIDVLNAILHTLHKKGVVLKTKHSWKGWSGKEIVVEHQGHLLPLKADIVVFSLGGATWSKTGSDGDWIHLFQQKDIYVNPFEASNCAYQVSWEDDFLKQTEGRVLKNVRVSCLGTEKKGELVITRFGIEGGPIYALSPQIRKLLKEKREATVYLDLKPDLSVENIRNKLRHTQNKTLTEALRNDLHLSTTQILLLKKRLSKADFLHIETLTNSLKNLPLVLHAAAPLDEAISSVGGISLSEITEDFELKKLPDQYAIGEMLDWDAPTGGYLLQACFSMGFYLAQKLNQKG